MPHSTRKDFEENAYFAADNSAYIDELYEQYLADHASVPSHWQQYFGAIQNGKADISHASIREQLQGFSIHAPTMSAAAPGISPQQQSAVDALITAYRRYGHLKATIDPLKGPIQNDVRLTLSHYGLSEADLQKTFDSRQLFSNEHTATLQEIMDALQRFYCGSIAFEYTRLIDQKERDWLQNYIECKIPGRQFSHDEKKNILEKLTQAEGLEKYLDTKYPGQKRFSIEGADTLIPMMDSLINDARAHNIREMMIGMAHRGRLNVLINNMGKPPKDLFSEFEGTIDYGDTTGDVKYHKGYSSDVETPHGPIHLSLGFNPSHLEFINTVVLGSVRARQERSKEVPKRDYAIALLIHGDAAFAGQGIVMETLAMSQTRAYTVGGAIHIVVNNQVGFTTSDPNDARSSFYCSDIAKMIDAPIMHVNGDDPEACMKAMQLALEYRATFHKDVVIDLVCYRVHGHNEADEPSCTQPLMYQIIRAKKSPREIYAERLIHENVMTTESVSAMMEAYRASLDKGISCVTLVKDALSEYYAKYWLPYLGQRWYTPANTAISKKEFDFLAQRIMFVPKEITLQRQVSMIMQARAKMATGEIPMDWGFAETMAYAALLQEGQDVRLTGEDVRRGTFFHRHAALFDQKTESCYIPLANISEKQAQVQIFDSLLSETGTLGFEYGYAATDANSLVMWEAQFGDFANVAQVIIDQFISSAWQKWNRLSGLVMLLPHGSEGMGPEHSSARLERYLQLCAQNNMQVCIPTTPAQIFHLLRRQVIRPFRQPLIVLTPKSLLRHKLATSNIVDLTEGAFQLVIPEIDEIVAKKVTRIVLCSGKIYYEILQKRREQEIEHIAVIRIEQLYPFPDRDLMAEIQKYPNVKEIVWCQEEPKNQGAFYASRHRIVRCMGNSGRKLLYAGRGPMAAPAAGYGALHTKLQAALVDQALGLLPAEESK